jgi:hypothetical protein
MRTQDTQGSFITLIRTFLAKAKEVSDVAPAASTADTGSVPVHPRADVVANLLLLRVLSGKLQERLADQDRLGDRVFRYSSSDPCVRCSASSSLSGVLK